MGVAKFARVPLALWAFAILGMGGGAFSAEVYHAQAIVTGQDEPERSRGLALCLKDALVEASGDARLLRDPRVDALLAHAGDAVAQLRYRDRMSGIPFHDEQGSHDRPYDLMVDFDAAKIDKILAELGDKPWTAPRPTLVALIEVLSDDAHYDLAADGGKGFGQRNSLAAVAARYGIAVKLPMSDLLGRARPEDLIEGNPGAAKLESFAYDAGGDAILTGSLTWREQPPAWTGEWRMIENGRAYRWSIAGVSYDEAFLNAVLGAEQILSGHGAPS
jgi:hypothetical protein